MAKKYFYECVYPCQVAFAAQSRRREDWMDDGDSETPTFVMHPISLRPRRVIGRGKVRPGDVIVTDKPLGKSYTTEIVKKVSRPSSPMGAAKSAERVMRPKVNKVKFKQVDERDVSVNARKVYKPAPQFRDMTEEEMQFYRDNDHPIPRDKQIQTGGWAASMFQDNAEDVQLPSETALMYAQGAALLSTAQGAEA